MQEEVMRLPVVALRGMVAFPYTVISFEIARDISISAINRAMEDNQNVFLSMQKEGEISNPPAVHEIGVVARVRNILKLPGESVRVLIEGLHRARMIDCLLEEDCYFANVVSCEKDAEKNDTTRAYMRLLIKNYEDYSRMINRSSSETLSALEDIECPSKLVDTLIVNALRKNSEKQQLLEELDVIKRYEYMLNYFYKEIEIASVEKEINLRTRSQIEKQQREHYLKEQIKAIQTSLGQDESEEEAVRKLVEAVENLPVSDETKEKLRKEAARLSRMNMQSPEYTISRTYLDWVTTLPYGIYSEENIDLENVSDVLDEDHYGMKKVKERILEYLAVRKLKNGLKGPILCLAGPPGVGKTSIASSIARAVGRKFVRMSLGGVRDEAEIRGHRRTYIGAIPGRIISNIKKAGTMNPLFLLDEIDKMSTDYRGDPASAMLEVLDPEINNTFQDHYLDIDFDLSSVMFVTTANDVDNIPRPLYDRMEIINLSSYTTYEKEQIAIRHLIPKQIESHGLSPKILKIDKAAIADMIVGYTYESGVRSLERTIAEVCRKSAKKYIDGKKRITVTSKNLETYIGIPKYTDKNIPLEDTIGVAVGLAWTAGGGAILPVEVCAMEGSGNIELTGQLGDVMKESAHAGISLVRSLSDQLKLPENFHKEMDLHIHVPEGAVQKDGPSAGITMALAVASSLTKRPIRSEYAMTGEITLTGRVLNIGGLKEKVLAAVRSGISKVIIPKGNVKDLEEMPKDINVKFFPVETFDEVLALALVEKKEENEEKKDTES